MCFNIFFFFFFNDTATTEIYTLSLHDALPISGRAARPGHAAPAGPGGLPVDYKRHLADELTRRSEEHTSELQSRQYLVCRLLLEKKKKKEYTIHRTYILEEYINYKDLRNKLPQ